MLAITRALLGTMLLLAPVARATTPYTSKCPEEDRNVLTVRSVRALVAERCGCGAAASRDRYVRCAKRQVNSLVRDARLSRSCRRVVVDFERQGTCGRRAAAVCCRMSRKGSVKAAVSGVARCERRGVLPVARAASRRVPPARTASTTRVRRRPLALPLRTAEVLLTCTRTSCRRPS